MTASAVLPRLKKIIVGKMVNKNYLKHNPAWVETLSLSKQKKIAGLKRTVARDFLVSVFLMDLLYMGLRFRG